MGNFQTQVAGLTVGDALELNRLTEIYGDLAPNGEVIDEGI